MKPSSSVFKPTEPYYRPGQYIEDSPTAQKSPISKESKSQSKSPMNNRQCEKSVPMSTQKQKSKPVLQEKFFEESIEDLLDEDEKYPGIGTSTELRAEPPSKDDEPEKVTFVTKPKEVKPADILPALKDQRRLSQETISPKPVARQPLAPIKSEKDLRTSAFSEKKAEFRDTGSYLGDPKTLSISQLSTNGSFGMYGKLLAPSAAGMTEADLVAENRLLRHFLRDLNDILNQQVAKTKPEEEVSTKKVEFRNKSPEEQKKTIVREIANNEKILAINKEEHRKAEAKVEIIKDPLHIANLQQEIDDIQAKIEEIKKENRKLLQSNSNVAKDLDMIENVKGVPLSIEETREKQIEIKLLSKKLDTLIQKNLAAEEEKTHKLEKRQTLATEIKKLERRGESFPSENSINKLSRLKYMALMAEEGLKNLQKRCRTKKTNAERELEQAIIQHRRETNYNEELDGIIKEQNAVLKGMISSERTKHNRSTQEVLDNLRYSLEHEENQYHKSSSSNYIKDERLEALRVTPNRPLKTKSIERGGGRVRRDLFEAQDVRKSHHSFSKHKNAVKRELIAAKASVWRESVNGDRARMEELVNMSPSRIRQAEHPELFLKPITNKKMFMVSSAKNSEDGDIRMSPVFDTSNNRIKMAPKLYAPADNRKNSMEKSASVKQIGSTGLESPVPFQYNLNNKGKDFNSDEWKGIEEENGFENSCGDNTARKIRQNKEKEVETAKPFFGAKEQKTVKRKSQLESISTEELVKPKTKKNSMEEEYGDGVGRKGVSNMSINSQKRGEQPDNSQKIKTGNAGDTSFKRLNNLKVNDLKKGKKDMDFEELDFDD